MQLFNTRFFYFHALLRYWCDMREFISSRIKYMKLCNRLFRGNFRDRRDQRESARVCARPLGYSVTCHLHIQLIQWGPKVWVINKNASVLHFKNEYNIFMTIRLYYRSSDLEFEWDVDLKQHETRIFWAPLYMKSSDAQA